MSKREMYLRDREIRYWLDAGLTRKDLAFVFDVNYSHIYNISVGKVWVLS